MAIWRVWAIGGTMVTIGSNASFAASYFNINRTASLLLSASNKLSAGKQILTGQDSPSLLSKLAELNSVINGISTASENASVARGYLNTADGGLESINSSLQQLRDLSVQASSDLLSPSERQIINNQANTILSDLNSTASDYNYNGIKLLDGSFGSKSIQVGPNEGNTLTISLADARGTALGLNSLDLSTSSSSSLAITSLDNALAQINTQRASVGTNLQKLDNTIITNATASANYESARSLLENLDLARGVANLTKLQIQQKANIQVFTATLKSEKSKLSIFA